MPPEDDQMDLAGYDSVNALAQGYRESGREAQRQKQRADQLEQRIQQIEQQFTRQTVPQRANPADRLSEFGVPVDALDEMISERVARGVQAAFEPLARGAQARTSILSRYKDYGQYEADVAGYIESDPGLSQRYQKLFAADPEAAMEFAFLKFGEAKRSDVASNGNGNPQRQARVEAQIPSARQGDARTLPQTDTADRTARSWEHYQKTGDPRAYAQERLRQVISDDFLGR